MPAPKTTADYNLARNRLLRKLDLTLLPLLTLLHIIATADKGAVGNAKIAGFERDLALNGLDYNIGLTLLFIFYSGCQIPSNLALRRFGSVWLAFLVISFGLVQISTAFIHDYAGFLATRILLGATESGMIPGMVYLLSLYYPRSNLVVRVAIFLTLGGTLAGACGGFLASGLLSINSIGSVVSWRKIFLVEGIVTTSVGIICVFIIPGHPKDSRYLTEDERALILEGKSKQNQLSDASQARMHPRLILRSCTFHVGICALGYLINNISLQGLTIFLPSIVANLGKFTTAEAQLRTVPPYFVAGAFAVSIAYMAYRVQRRGIFIAITTVVTIIGYAIFAGSDPSSRRESHLRYGACFLSLAGSVSTSPMFVSWGNENVIPETERAIATAIVTGTGAVGSLISVWAYLPKDAPKYHHSHLLNLAGACINWLLGIIGMLYLYRKNRERDDGERSNRLIEKSKGEISEFGSQHSDDRYQP